MNKPLPPTRQRLVEENMGLIYHVVNRNRHILDACGMNMEDAEQEAAVGLVRAATSYDPSRNMAFSSYAAPSIYRALQRGATYDHIIRRPANPAMRNGKRPKGYSADDWDNVPDVLSMNTPLRTSGPGTLTLGDTLSDADFTEDVNAVADIMAAISKLPRHYRQIIHALIQDKTLSNVARQRGCSAENVRQQARKAKRLLRAYLAEAETGTRKQRKGSRT